MNQLGLATLAVRVLAVWFLAKSIELLQWLGAAIYAAIFGLAHWKIADAIASLIVLLPAAVSFVACVVLWARSQAIGLRMTRDIPSPPQSESSVMTRAGWTTFAISVIGLLTLIDGLREVARQIAFLLGDPRRAGTGPFVWPWLINFAIAIGFVGFAFWLTVRPRAAAELLDRLGARLPSRLGPSERFDA